MLLVNRNVYFHFDLNKWLDYLPGESVRPAGLFFTRDPRAHRLEIRPAGFVAP